MKRALQTLNFLAFFDPKSANSKRDDSDTSSEQEDASQTHMVLEEPTLPEVSVSGGMFLDCRHTFKLCDM